MKKEILERYAINDKGEVVVEIAAEKVEDLYSNFDKTAPYMKKDLDQNLVDYITASVEEIGSSAFIIHFCFSQLPQESAFERVRTSMQNFFLYLKELEVRKLDRMRRRSYILFGIGIVLLTLSISLGQEFEDAQSVMSGVFTEGLTIAAWVSLWEALATFLIDWTPHRQKIRVFERIANAAVQFRKNDGVS